jgi:hypothetical protein
MLSFFARRQENLANEDPEQVWNTRLEEVRPVAPYNRDVGKAIPRIFDRACDPPGKPVPRHWLRTVSDVLRDYHRQPEYKFLGGGWNQEGVLRRRHVFAERIEDIGKESDGWEEDEARTVEQDLVISYSSALPDREHMLELARSVPKRELQREARIAMRTIDAVHDGSTSVSDRDLWRLADAAGRIRDLEAQLNAKRSAALEWLKRQVAEIGLAALARKLGEDKANLSKVISARRLPSAALLGKVAELLRHSH